VIRLAERAFANLIGWPILRLSLGRWPDRAERHRFARGFCDRPATMPALLRGLGSIPTIRNHFMDALNPALPAMPPLMFVHVEKTAGSSVVEYLRTQFAPDDIDPDPMHGAPGHLLSPLPADKRRYALIWGHQDLPALLRCQPPSRFVLMFFRDPHRRILSLYDYWRAVRPEEIAHNEPHIGMAAARDRTLLGFLQSQEPEVRDFIDNVYARRLTGIYTSHAAPGAPPVSMEVLTAAALAALDHITCFGIAEEMGVSLQVLAARTGATLPAIVPHENALQGLQLDVADAFQGVRRSRPTAQERAALDRLTVIDRQIYAIARQRLNEQKLAIPARFSNPVLFDRRLHRQGETA
jgi:hypothetical protein